MTKPISSSAPATGPSTHRLPVLLLSAALLVSGYACASEDAADGADAAAGTSEAAAAEDTAATEAAAPFDPSTLPAVVARVGDQEITRQDLLEEAQGARAQLLQRGVPTEATESEEFYRQALDQIVAGILIYEEAQAEGLVPTDAEVEQQVQALRSQVPEGQTFEQALAATGVTREQLEKEIRMTGALQRVVSQKIVPQVTVSEEEARSFYQENLDRMKKPARARVRHILVKVAADGTPEARQAAREKVEGLRSQISSGADFAALAREHSEDQVSRERGGELPWIAPGQTVPAFEQAAFDLEPGELSGVVESPFGYHVIQGLERQSEATAPFDEVKERILAMLREQQAREQLHTHVDALKNEKQVEILL